MMQMSSSAGLIYKYTWGIIPGHVWTWWFSVANAEVFPRTFKLLVIFFFLNLHWAIRPKEKIALGYF